MEKINKYASKRFKNLTSGLKSFRHVQDPELLHSIRVEIKRIKTLLHLLNFSNNKFNDHKRYIPFRMIFRKAGEIRQPEVIYKLLLEYQISGVRDQQIPLAKKSDKLSAAFQKNVPAFINSVKHEFRKLEKHYLSIKKTDVFDYQKKLKKNLARLLVPKFNKAKLHKIRKLIKEIIYLHTVSKKGKSIAFFKNVEDIIGRWHDKQMLIAILKRSETTQEISGLEVACEEDVLELEKGVSVFYEFKQSNLT